MRRLIFAVVMIGSLGLGNVAWAGLKVGDKAPALSVKHWINGSVVDPTAAKPDEVFVVEFWATWCLPCLKSIPHLSEMQAHFKSKGVTVTVIGISDESKGTVEKFMKKTGSPEMRYTVAIDDNRKTNRDWMQAAGQTGIPTAFIVKGGTVRWIGNPLGEPLDVKVAELCGDTSYVERKKKLRALQTKLTRAFQGEKWGEALAAIDEMLAIDPHDIRRQLDKYYFMVAKLDQAEQGAKYGRKMVESAEDSGGPGLLAWVILTHDDFKDRRDMELALAAAKKAMALSEEKDPDIMDTYARVLAETGDLKGAVDWQTKALELCKNRRDKRKMKRALAKYEEKLNNKGA